MAAMTNITVSYADTTYTWNASTPGGATEPARWRGASLAPLNITSRVAQATFSYKYARNAANTADRVTISGYVPIVCTGDACIPTNQGRVPFNFTLALPDVLDDTMRSNIVDVIVNTLASDTIKSGIVNGEGFY